MTDLGLYAVLLIATRQASGEPLENAAEHLDAMLADLGEPSTPAEVRTFLTEITRRHPFY